MIPGRGRSMVWIDDDDDDDDDNDDDDFVCTVAMFTTKDTLISTSIS